MSGTIAISVAAVDNLAAWRRTAADEGDDERVHPGRVGRQLRLEQRADVERMIGELGDTGVTELVASADDEAVALEDALVLGFSP